MRGLIIVPSFYGLGYITMGRYYSLFNKIKNELGFDIIVSDNYNIERLDVDIIISFKSPQKDNINLMTNLLKLPKGIKLIGYFADVHDTTDYSKSMPNTSYKITMRKMLERCDKILCSYDHTFKKLWPDFVDKYTFFHILLTILTILISKLMKSLYIDVCYRALHTLLLIHYEIILKTIKINILIFYHILALETKREKVLW